jgi:hypothetical protein
MSNKINNSVNNNIYNISGKNGMDKEPKSFQDQVDMLLQKISTRAEREVPEYGDFAPVNEDFPNLDKNTQVSKYGLSIYKMPKNVVPDEKKRYVEASAYPLAGDYRSRMVVGSGNKEEVLKLLNSKDFAEKLNSCYADLVEALKD